MKEKQIEIYKKNIIPLVEKIDKMSIKTAEDMKEASLLLSQLNKYADNVQEKKEVLTKPINLALKNIRTMFKEVEDKYKGGIKLLREKMETYQTKALEKQKKEEEKIAGKLADGKMSIEKAVEKMEDVSVTGKIETKEGDVKFVTVMRIMVKNIQELPIEYHLPNEVLIRHKFKDEGLRLPGVEYIEEQSVRNYR